MKNESVCERSVATNGNRFVRRRSKVRIRVPVPFADIQEISSLKLPLVFYWNGADNAAFGFVDPRMNRISKNCRNVPDRFYGCALPCRYATVSEVLWACVKYRFCAKIIENMYSVSTSKIGELPTVIGLNHLWSMVYLYHYITEDKNIQFIKACSSHL